MEKIIQIKKRIQAARDRQKSYADRRRKPLEFQGGDKVMLKVSPWKGVIRFGKREKLNPHYIGPFKILAKVGTVAYRLELPEQLSRVHSTFHVSNLKKCFFDVPLAIPLDEIQIDDKLNFIEEPVEIMDREFKRLNQSRIPIVKVRWNSGRGPEVTWEREDQMKKKYPHLFANPTSASKVTLRRITRLSEVSSGAAQEGEVIKAVKNWKALKSLLEIQSFLGLTEQEEDFQTLKDNLCNAPILTLPDGPDDFVVYCDASSEGFGCVLMQRGKLIAYVCRQLKIHEKSYTTHDLGMGAELNMRQRRWIKLFSDYDYEIHYHPGKANVDKILEAQMEASKVENASAEMLCGLDQQMVKKEYGGLYFMDQNLVPLVGSVRTLIMDEAHASRYSDHSGVDKMYYELRDMYWWPGSWDTHLPLADFSYNNSYHFSIQCAPFEALYGRKCRSPILWAENRESRLISLEMVHETTNKVVQIKERIKAARDRQKSYADNRRKPLEFSVGD
ncbi:putative reverse transcriptase domain-containing protein [Tanacetum coccineum]